MANLKQPWQYEDMIHIPTFDTDGIVKLCEIDTVKLTNELKPYLETMSKDKKQIGLRWAHDFEGLGDLRDTDYNPKGYKTSDFRHWQPNTTYLQEVCDTIRIRFYGRVRLLLLEPHACYTLHADPDRCRVHIPLVTNKDALFFVNGKMWHMEVGHAYLMQVSNLHTALNAGLEDRIHIVFDRCDYLVN